MDDKQPRTHYLQQIPVFALRKQLYGLLEESSMSDLIRNRIQNSLQIQSSNPRDTIRYLTQDKLILLIEACPEISPSQIDHLYEEYRYGQNPTLYIFLFNPRLVRTSDREQIENLIRADITAWNMRSSELLPLVKSLELDSLWEIIDRPDLLEGSYRFLRRMDYIDEEQNPTSAYETLYGFFWINTQAGYCVIHGRETSILKALEIAIEHAIRVNLVNLIITTELKNSLPFLLEESLRSSRLHDPDPESTRFRWITIADDAPYTKGYRELESSYPEVRDARYRISIDEQRETSLTIRLDRGVISLAGKLSASQFRKWALISLDEIITKLKSLHTKPTLFIKTRGFRGVPELARYTAAQKDSLLRLTADLLELKVQPGVGYRATGISPLALANRLQQYVRVYLHLVCPQDGCDQEGYFACEICGSTEFLVVRREDGFALKCRNHRSKPWSASIPFQSVCSNGHTLIIDSEMLEENLLLLPGDQFLQSISDFIAKYIPAYHFDPSQEHIYIRGRRVYYSAEPPIKLPDQQVTIFNNISVGKVESGGSVTGVVLDGSSSAQIHN